MRLPILHSLNLNRKILCLILFCESFVQGTTRKSLNALHYIGYYKFFKVISHANTVHKIIQVGNTKVKNTLQIMCVSKHGNDAYFGKLHLRAMQVDIVSSK